MSVFTTEKDQKNLVIEKLAEFFSSVGVKKESAVSPVVGIMLMITITLILAAIISGMTGGIAQKQEKPPQLLFEASVFINSTGKDSFLDIRVVSVSQGIPTRDLKLVTEWRGDGEPNRTVITPLSKNVDNEFTYPVGYEPGGLNPKDFGNFTLLGGTRMSANSTDIKYMDATLKNWKNIRDGTTVRIQFIHVPSGAIIADKEVTAEVINHE
ncbi:hypothetical protein Mhun_0310 [Methanospirillum hungatei JF-1]|jgi:FlaG/FlaF family flagellin (archaellin)|uniref:Archaeal Type IV pilin N-terminal domain-containing protein n=1 Tax=Methanospirillum hungatei JF-1 (strain ATCC 27890 / DSM 864 / NBRC 100397 / JF-1) TaxID=323259 RepID=Q2FPS8_METHJ|nr:type IV pilin N-terminal domain-containing protein [Methanospirillum hungatei]ABD40080.1 hypothetical protein Mhun_0310 [Methanospirillum hungatei JF-1]